jgi:hypothetical protein
MEPRVAETIPHDNNRGSWKLFVAIAKACIMHNNSLESLRQAIPWGDQQGSTWAANWTWEGRMPSWRPGYLGCAPGNVFDSGEETHARVGVLVAIMFGCSSPLLI